MKVQFPIIVMSSDDAKAMEEESKRNESMGIQGKVDEVYTTQLTFCDLEDIGPFWGNVFKGRQVTYVTVGMHIRIVPMPFHKFREGYCNNGGVRYAEITME